MGEIGEKACTGLESDRRDGNFTEVELAAAYEKDGCMLMRRDPEDLNFFWPLAQPKIGFASRDLVGC